MFDLNKYFTKETFDAAPAEDEFALLPKGWYRAIIPQGGIEEKQTNSGKTYVNIRFNVTADNSGKPMNRVHFQPLYIGPDYSEGANAMGASFIKKMAVAANGSDAIRGLEELMNKPIEIFVTIEVDKKGEFDDRNRVQNARKIRDAVAKPATTGWN